MDLCDINRAITLIQNKLSDNAFDFNDNTIDPNRTYKFIKRKRIMRKMRKSSNDITIMNNNENSTIKSQNSNMFDKFLKEEYIIIKNIENQIKSLGLNIS